MRPPRPSGRTTPKGTRADGTRQKLSDALRSIDQALVVSRAVQAVDATWEDADGDPGLDNGQRDAAFQAAELAVTAIMEKLTAALR